MSISIKKMFMTKKVVVVGAAVAVALGASTAAFAYFTSNGTGSGSASVGQATSLTIVGGSASGLLPGAKPTPVAFTMDNNSGTSENFGVVSIDPATIVVTLAGAGAAANTADPTLLCPSTDFVVVAGSKIGTIPTGTFDSSTNTSTEPTIQLTETGHNQDACQNAALSFTMNAAQGS